MKLFRSADRGQTVTSSVPDIHPAAYAIGIALLSIFIAASTALAAPGVNRTINFQGKVVNKVAGTNVTNGNYDFTFRLYDAGSGGTLLWTENWTGGNQVAVTDGIFRVALGSVTTFASANVDFNSDSLYLDITFNGETMGSRVRFTAVPYALNAEKVSGLTVTNNGGNTLNIAANKTFTVNNTISFSGTDSTSFTLPTSGDTLVGLTVSQTLTNKKIGDTGLTFENDEGIYNGTNGTLTLGRNDSGTVTLTAKDDDSTAALTILPGGASGLILGGGSMTGLTVTTDGTGNDEVILPDGSISSTEFLDGSLLPTDLDLTTADSAGDEECLTYESDTSDFEWQSCGSGTGTNYWQLNSGSLSPFSLTADLNLGATATSSAKISLAGSLARGKAAAIINQTETNQDIFTASSSGTTRFTITGEGNVGIKTSPSTNTTLNLANISTMSNDLYGVRSNVEGNDGSDYLQDQYGGYFSAGGSGSMNSSYGVYGISTADNFNSESIGVYGVGGTHGVIGSSGAIGVLGSGDVNGGYFINSGASGTALVATQGNGLGLGLYVAGRSEFSATANTKALVMLNQTGNKDIFTASASGTTRFTLGNNGNIVQTTGETTGNAYTLNANSLTTGNGLSINTSGSTFASGKLLDLNLTTTNTAGGTKYGSLTTISNTGATSTSDSTIGNAISINRTGASAGDVFTTGQSVAVLGDLAGNSFTKGYYSEVGGTDDAIGFQSLTWIEDQSGNFGTYTAGDFLTQFGGDGTMGTAYGVKGQVNLNGSGTITTAHALYSKITNAFEIGTAYGLLIDSPSDSGDITNNYGLYVNDQSGSGSTNSYNVYSAGATAKNYFAGLLEADGAVRFDSATITLGNAAFANCATLGTSSNGLTCGIMTPTQNYWQLNSGALSPFSLTADLNLGATATASAKISLAGSLTRGNALAIFNQTEDQDILTASASGVMKFTLDRNGNLGLAGSTVSPSNYITTPNFSVSTAGAGSFTTGTVIGSQTFTTNNIADSGALTIKSGGSNALTLDTTAGAAVNIANTNATSVVIGNTANTATQTFNTSATSGNGFTFVDTALTSGNAMKITAGNPKANNNSGTLTSGDLINVSSANHTYMSLDNRDLTIGGHKNNITIANVVKVYIYDTTKDTDGGRWTDGNRSQAASWYNEAIDNTGDACVIDTNDRCGSQYFPEKAIIVASTTKIYIFDAKDNTLWMDFRKGSGATEQMIGPTTTSVITSISAYNGKIYIGNSGATGYLYAINFIRDISKRYNATDDYQGDKNIANRNTTVTWMAASGQPLASNNINDVYSQVVNGKQYLAIAHASAANGSVSVINETDQTVTKFGPATAASTGSRNVFLTAAGSLYATIANSTGANYAVKVKHNMQNVTVGSNNALFDEVYLTASTTVYGATTTDNNNDLTAGNWAALVNGPAPVDTTFVPNALFVTYGTSLVNGRSNTIYVGNNDNLTVIQEKQYDPANGSVKYYTSSFITEELVGDSRAFLPLNGSAGVIANNTNITDSTVKANAFTVKNANGTGMAYGSGVRGTGITAFDNTDDYICTGTTGTCADDADLDSAVASTGSFTIGAWVKRSATGTAADVILAKWGNTAANQAYRLQFSGTDIPTFEQGSGGATTTSVGSALTDTTNWHYIVGVFDNVANNQYLYIDGVKVDTDANANNTADSGVAYTIGADLTGGGNASANFFRGAIDEPFMVAEALNDAQVKQLYKVGYRAAQNHTSDTLQKVNGTNSQVNAVVVDSDEGGIYVGTNSDGGVTVLGADSDTQLRTYTTSTTDDTNSAFGSNVINSISFAQGFGGNTRLIAIGNNTSGGASTQVYFESTDTSFRDLFVQSYNPFGSSLTQNTLNVDTIFRVTNPISSKTDNLTFANTAWPAVVESFRVDGNGAAVQTVGGTLSNVGNATYNGMVFSAFGNAITHTGAATTTINLSSMTMPRITQTAGALTVNGQNITFPVSAAITTGGTMNGLNITAPTTSGPAAGTMTGINIAGLTSAGAGTERGINVGTGWDIGIKSESGISFGAQTTLADSTTPSVAGGSHFASTNSVNRLTTNFTGGTAGQLIFIEVTNANLDLDCTANANFNCGITADITAIAANDMLSFIYDGTVWNLLTWARNSTNNSDNADGVDLAEYYASDEDLQPGEVVSIDPEKDVYVTKSSGRYDKRLMGIVSTQPGLLLGNGEAPYVHKIALAGRVPTKVSTENGPIFRGDSLTASSIPGVAMKATEPGPTIGKALQTYSSEGIGSIEVFVNLSWYYPSLNLEANLEGLTILENRVIQLEEQVASLSAQMSVLSSTSSTSAAFDALWLENILPRRQVLSSATSSGLLAIDLTVDNNATIAGKLRVKGSSLFEDIVTMIDTLITDNIIVNGTANFFKRVVIRDDVEIRGKLTVSADTTGTAVIEKGQDHIAVSFVKEYDATPFVTTSIALDTMIDEHASDAVRKQQEEAQSKLEDVILSGDIQYVVTRKTKKGFIIKLNKKAPEDIQFAWTALAQSNLSKKETDSREEKTDTMEEASIEVLEAATSVSPTKTAVMPGGEFEKTVTILDSELGYLRVRKGSKSTYDEVGQVKPGETFGVLESENGWFRIEFEPGKTGWISSLYVSVKQ